MRNPEPVTCEICGKLRIAAGANGNRLIDRNICRACYQKEPSTLCAHCKLRRHHVSIETGFCPRCTNILTRPTGLHQYARGEHPRVECSICGEVKYSALPNN